ncbi:HEAT repeat domain-containing protein [Candidatus Poribacteria bacterium]|nr:HEAT repeat domain-containing protein [Candidatus Poribacteria bacterium]
MLETFAIETVGSFTASVLMTVALDFENGEANARELLATVKVEPFLLEAVRESTRWQSRLAAFNALGKIIRALPVEMRFSLLDFSTVHAITSYSMDPQENIWVQCRAIQRLAEMQTMDAVIVMRSRLLMDESGIYDNLFVRRAILDAIVENYRNEDGLDLLRDLAEQRDPSDYVRVRLMTALAKLGMPESRELLRRFVEGGFDETCPQMRAQAVSKFGGIARDAAMFGDMDAFEEAARAIAWAAEHADHPLVQRVAFEEAEAICNARATTKEGVDALDRIPLAAIENVLRRAELPGTVRHWATQAWEGIVVASIPGYESMRTEFLPRLQQVEPGKRYSISSAGIPPEGILGRFLAAFMADRIPRSKVFAEILVMDISAHKHFLIGTNLSGLHGYMLDALGRRLENLYLIHPERLSDTPSESLSTHALASVDRVLDELTVEARSSEDVVRLLSAMLTGVGLSPEFVASVTSDAGLLSAIESAHGLPASDREWERNEAPQAKADADRLAERIASEGIDPLVAGSVAQFLLTYVHDAAEVHELREFVRSQVSSQGMPAASLDGLSARVRACASGVHKRSIEVIPDAGATGDQIIDRIARCSPPGFTVRIMGVQNIKGTGLDFAYRWLSLEKVHESLPKLESHDDRVRMDTFDSRSRSRKAASVFQDLVRERISHEMAAVQLRELTKRQKGGWLEKDVRAAWRRVFAPRA